MDKYTLQEQAYKNGYQKGYKDAMASIVRCKDCKYWNYDARKLCGLCDALICYRPDYFWCMYGERKDNERKADAVNCE